MNYKTIYKRHLILISILLLPLMSYSKTIIDMAGRKVDVPDKIKSVLSYDPKTSLVIFPLAPDLLKTKAFMLSKKKIVKVSPLYTSIPSIDVKNLEEILMASPDVIIAGVYSKKTSLAKFNRIQKKVKTPFVVIDLSIDKMDQTYKFLGQLLGVKQKAKELSTFIKTIYKSNDSLMNANPLNTKTSVYYTLGEDGLMTDPSGSMHTQLFDMMKIPNAAKIDLPSKGHAKVNIEQVIAWNPSHIFSSNYRATNSAYDIMKTSTQWSSIDAVKNKNIFKVPDQPYGWINHPPSINRIAGIIWLDHIFYKDSAEAMKSKMIKFYKLFYKYDLSEKEYNGFLK